MSFDSHFCPSYAVWQRDVCVITVKVVPLGLLQHLGGERRGGNIMQHLVAFARPFAIANATPTSTRGSDSLAAVNCNILTLAGAVIFISIIASVDILQV